MKNKKIIIIISIVIICFCLTLTTLARYTKNSIWNYYLESHGFYISSDNLGNNYKNVNTLWDGNSVHFNIKNSINDSQVTEYDIRYKVTCEVISDPNINCTINNTGQKTLEGVLSNNSRCINDNDDQDVSNYNKTMCEMNGYTWKNNPINQDMYFDVDTQENTLTIEITLETLSPFKKTLTGTFNLYKNKKDEGKITSKINDYTDYSELIITNTYETNRCATVKFDNTKQLVEYQNDMIVTNEDEYIKEFKIEIESQTNKKINFYNISSKQNMITVEETNC